MQEISAVIITYNEERNIERCILSVKNLADEIIVVDSGSTDRTEEICRAHGVNFIKHPFEGHIQQKNFASSQAKYNLVLSLDADESPDEKLKSSILEIKSSDTNADGYTMNRLTSYCGQWIRHCGWYPDVKLRLYKKSSGHWTGINPHDRYETHPGKTVKHLDGDILHYSYHTISDHLKQIDSFSRIGAEALFAKGKRISIPMLIIKPVARFIRNYILRSGFRDGFYGLVICVNTAHAVFLKYARLYEMQQIAKKRG